MNNISNRSPTVDASRAQPRTPDELSAREGISQPRNVPAAPPLESHRSSQAVMKQVDPTSARLQAPPGPSARAAAQAKALPAPNLFERLAQAVSTAYHEYRANSAAGDLAKHIKTGRFDASSVDLMADLTRHAAHLDPAGARQARSHPAIAILQGKLSGADTDARLKVQNSPVFGELKAANARTQATVQDAATRLASQGAGGSAQARSPSNTAPAANRHLDKLQLLLGHALRGPGPTADPESRQLTVDSDASAEMARQIDQQVRDRWLASVKSETALPTEYAAADPLPASRLDRAKLSDLGKAANSHAEHGSFLDIKAAQVRASLRQPRLEPSPQTVRERSLQAEHMARDGLASLLRGMDEPSRRRELLSLAQGSDHLARGAMHLLGQGNSVQSWRAEPDGLPSEVTFGGQRYQFDRQLGAGANGLALRYRPAQGDGPGIVLKATKDPMGDLAFGEADREVLGKVGSEFANHMHAMGEDLQGHPNLLAVKGLIVAHSPSLTHVDGISLFTVMEEAGPGPEDLVKDINLLRQTDTISEATHGLLMRSLFAQMVEGCAHLEDRQVAHRDIKLENMLVSRDGRVLIMDLGEGDIGALSEPAPRAGSPLSMSPELLNESEAHKVDTWALGVVWRQMSNSLGEADPRLAAVLGDQRDGDVGDVNKLTAQRTAWTQDPTNAIHRPAPLPSGRGVGNLDGIQQLTNAMLAPDQAQRPTIASLRSHHAIADPALQDPRLLELTRAIQSADGIAIARLNQSLTASAGRAGPGASG